MGDKNPKTTTYRGHKIKISFYGVWVTAAVGGVGRWVSDSESMSKDKAKVEINHFIENKALFDKYKDVTVQW